MRRLALLVPTALVGGLLFPLVSAAGGGCHPISTGEITQARAAKGEVTVTIAECSFDPAVLYAEPGTTLTWFNKDPVPHSVSGVNLAWGSEDLLQQEDTVSLTFEDEGVYPYYCVLHPGMVGAVVVGDPDPSDLPLAGSVVSGGEPPAGESGSRPAAASESVSDRSAAPYWVGAALIAALALFGLLTTRVRRRRQVLEGF
jgi:plastocyanin